MDIPPAKFTCPTRARPSGTYVALATAPGAAVARETDPPRDLGSRRHAVLAQGGARRQALDRGVGLSGAQRRAVIRIFQSQPHVRDAVEPATKPTFAAGAACTVPAVCFYSS
jgi:hypothetical protein